jgi:hypothetical protein
MSNPSKQFEMIRLYPRLSSDPTSGRVGEIYYNTTLNSLRLCTSSLPTWTNVGENSSTFQDKNALLIEGGVWSNSFTSPDNTISFDQSAFIQLPGFDKESNEIAAGSYILNDQEVLYVDINRTVVSSTLTPLTANINAITSNSDRLIIARNIGGTIIVGDRLCLPTNSLGSLTENQTSLDTQNSNLRLIDGGIWSFSSSNSLSLSSDAYIQVPGLLSAANTISSGPYTVLPGNILYCELNKEDVVSTLFVQEVSVNTLLPLNSFVLAYNDGLKVWISDNFVLNYGESKEAGQNVSSDLLSSIGASNWTDKEGQLRILKDATPSSITYITPLNKTIIDGTIKSLSIKNSNAIFDGAKIDWEAGEIYDYSGATLLSTFTPPNTEISDGYFKWYSIALIAGAIDINNEIELILTITASSGESLFSANAPKALYPSSSIHVGQVSLGNIGGTIEPIFQSDIIQNTLGAGAGGANVNLSNLETTAINQDLLPATTNSKDIGSELLAFQDVFSYAIRTNAITTLNGLGSVTVGNPLTMANNGISNLADPLLAQDAATKFYVDAADSALDARLSDLEVDPVTKTYVDNQDALKLDLAGGTMSGNIDMGNNTITNVLNPTAPQDVATKDYVDNLAGSGTSTFAAAQSQLAYTNVTGFSFSASGKGLIEVVIDATSDLYEVFDLIVVKKGSTYAVDYISAGDASGVDFNITSSGQIQYISDTYAGFNSLTIKFKKTEI